MTTSVSLVASTARSSSLSDLLKLLLDLDAATPVAATPSFGSWLRNPSTRGWPPSKDARSGLWLMDTRDEDARRGLFMVTGASGIDEVPCDAALILTGTGRPGSTLRRLLRNVRRPGSRRLPPDRLFQASTHDAFPPFVHQLGFDDGPEVPEDFAVRGAADCTGTAFLVTQQPVFGGSLWSSIADFLAAGPIEIDSFQLRLRGAAVVMLRAAGRPFVVRLVPPGPFQAVVARNHRALMKLRESLGNQEQLLERIPEPLFSEQAGGAAVFGETRISGTLAWKVVTGSLAPVVYRNTVYFLDTLRSATAQAVTLDRERLRGLLEEERSLLAGSSFVSASIRHALTREIDAAAAQLEGTELTLYASHGDFGYGNVLVDGVTGQVEGVIDWDTARLVDFPGIDRVNLEIQIRRRRQSLASAVESVWQLQSAHDALQSQAGPATSRALFALAVCRYISRSLRYPELFAREAAGFERVLQWLSRTGP